MAENTFDAVIINRINRPQLSHTNNSSILKFKGIFLFIGLLISSFSLVASNGNTNGNHLPYMDELSPLFKFNVLESLPIVASPNLFKKKEVQLLDNIIRKIPTLKPIQMDQQINVKTVVSPLSPDQEAVYAFDEKSGFNMQALMHKYNFAALAKRNTNIHNQFKLRTASQLPDQVTQTIAQRRTWIEDNEMITDHLKDMKNAAAVEGKLYLLKFEASWCAPCKIMEKNTFGNNMVAEYMADHYKKMNVNIDDFDGITLKQIYDIKVLPSILIFNSKGNLIAKYEKAMSAKEMLSILELHNIEQNKIQDENDVMLVNANTDIGKLNTVMFPEVNPGYCRK